MRKLVFTALVLVAAPAVAQDISMPREQWLANLRPLLSDNFCASGSPFLQAYKGQPADCPGTVDGLFDKCTTAVPRVVVPDTIVGVAEANKYGSIVAECVSAHYMGGDVLKVFLMIQDVTNGKPAGGS